MFGKAGAKTYKPDELLLTWGEAALEAEFKEVPVQSLEEMKKAVMSIAAAFKAVDKTKKPSSGEVPQQSNKRPVPSKSIKQ